MCWSRIIRLERDFRKKISHIVQSGKNKVSIYHQMPQSVWFIVSVFNSSQLSIVVFPLQIIFLCGIQESLTRRNKQQNSGCQGLSWEKQGDVSQRVQAVSYTMNKFWGSIYSMVMIVIDTLLYTRKLLRKQIMNPHFFTR